MASKKSSPRGRNKWGKFPKIRNLDQLKKMDPIVFENYVGMLFEKRGYKARPTKASADEGIDLIISKRRKKGVVQVKRYSGTVGQPIVRDLYGTMMHNNVDEAWLVTTGRVSRAAEQWAADKPIHLIDGHELMAWVRGSRKPSKTSPKVRDAQPVKFTGLIPYIFVFLLAGFLFITLRQPPSTGGESDATTTPTDFVATETPVSALEPSPTLLIVSTQLSPPTSTPEPLPTATALVLPTITPENPAVGVPAGLDAQTDLVFSSRYDAEGNALNNFELFRFEWETGEITRLTRDPANDYHPALSPSGEQLAFVSDRDGNPELYTMSLDGSNLRRLTENAVIDTQPDWAPSGQEIAYVSYQDGNPEIYTLFLRVLEPERVTNNPSTDLYPHFAPTGRILAFASSQVQTLMGSNLDSENLESAEITDAFFDIYSVNLKDNRGSLSLVRADGVDTEPSWGRQGNQLVFVSDRNGNPDVFLYDLDAVQTTQLTITDGVDSDPTLSANGQFVAFVVRSGNSSEGTLSIVPVNGGDPYQPLHPRQLVFNLDW
jgi:Tol biopolymer transport system component